MRSGWRNRLTVRRALALTVEVALAQLHRIETEQRRAAAEDVLDHQHALWTAEAAERRVRRLVGLGDAAVHPDVGEPVGVVDVAQRAGEHRLREVEAPAAVGGQGRVQGDDAPVLVEADPPVGMEPVPLARHGQVLGAVQPQPDRTSGERRTQRGDRRKAVRLHLLAAEAAAHAQALHRDLVVVPAQHVGHDLLRLGGVLGAALDEDLLALVDVGQGAMGLEIEVLLAGELEVAAEDMGGGGEAGLDVAPPHLRHRALEGLGLDRLGHLDVGGERLDLDLDSRRAEPGGLERLAQHPAHGVAVEHDLTGKQRLVVLDPGVVDPGNVRRGEHPDDAGHGQRGVGAQRGDPAVRQPNLHGIGVQHVLGALHQVVGVERLAGDVQGRALVRDRDADGRALGSFRQGTHADTSSGFSAYSLSRP